MKVADTGSINITLSAPQTVLKLLHGYMTEVLYFASQRQPQIAGNTWEYNCQFLETRAGDTRTAVIQFRVVKKMHFRIQKQKWLTAR